MKKHLYHLFMVFCVVSFTFLSCSDDDESNEQQGNSTTLKVNGVDWIASNANPPLFHGDLSNTDWTKSLFVLCKFTRNDNEYFPSCVRFDISMDVTKGHGITKGMDIATSEYLFWGGGNNEYDFWEGTFGEDDYIDATYGGSLKATGGSAVIVDFKDKEFLTIKFSNFKLPLMSNNYGKSPETLTLDGTVTYKYTDALSDVCN